MPPQVLQSTAGAFFIPGRFLFGSERYRNERV